MTDLSQVSLFGPSITNGPGPRDVDRAKPKPTRRVNATTGSDSERELVNTVEAADAAEISKKLAGEGQEDAAEDRRRHAPPPVPRTDADDKPRIDLSA